MNENVSLLENAVIKRLLYDAQIELNTTCNWNCIHCYLENHKENGLSNIEVFEILDQLRNLGVFEVEFTGGEIFLRKDIFQIIEYARKKGFKVTLLSNISLLDDYEKVNYLRELGVSKILCTVFSMKDEIHDEISCNKGSLKKVLNAITLIRKNRIPLEIKTIVMKKNAYDFREVREYCRKNEIDFLATTTVFESRNDNITVDNLFVDDEIHKQIIKEIDECRKTDVNNDDNSYICESTRHHLYIRHNGDVTPCSNLPLVVGNIHKESISHIWAYSEKLLRIQNYKWKDLKECTLCKYREICVRCGGCSYAETGDLLECDKSARRVSQARYTK